MNISFIGAGKVGTAFGMYIKEIHQVLYYYSRTMASAMKASHKVGARPTNDLGLLIEASDVVIITTGDQNIQEAIKAIDGLKMDLAGKLFVHMSGALTSACFKALVDRGAKGASMHPLQTFPTPEKGLAHLKTAYFALEGACDLPKQWLQALGNPYFELRADQKSKYHMAACIFSNYMVTLMAFGSEMLAQVGIDEGQGLEAMMPLIEATLENTRSLGPRAALTGPIQRGDGLTLEKHMETIEGLDLSLYKTLMAWTSERMISDPGQQEMLKALWRTHE